MWYEDPNPDDQVAAGGGPGGPAARPASTARLLLAVQPQGLHPAPALRPAGPEAFFKTDYRGLTQMLEDFAELRRDLGLGKVPHYSTLCYAERRLLKGGPSSPSCCARPGPPATAA